MYYLTQPESIQNAIATLKTASILWLDTETADYKTKTPQLSLIQVLADPTDLEGEQVYILDLLNYPDLLAVFIEEIMINPQIEKVFHSAQYDCKFLGKKKVKNVTCTLEIAKKIPYYLLATPNFTLKTLAEKLCSFPTIDKTEQTSDWKQRPLSEKQLQYAMMDVVYVAQIHTRLLQLTPLAHPAPETENISALTLRYRQLEHRWQQLDSEINHLKERIKQAMSAQNLKENQGFKLTHQSRVTKKTSFQDLAQLVQESNLDLEFKITLTQALQKQLGAQLENLPLTEEVKDYLQLKITNTDENELPF